MRLRTHRQASLGCRVEEVAVNNAPRTEDLTDDPEFEDLVKELDAILEAWFMADVAPSLDEARRARARPPAQSTAA